MAKAYSYIRFSRPEQMRGDSLRRQTEAAERWAADNGMVIDESLTDLGVSAYRGLNRVKGALGKFLGLVEKGQIPKGSFLIIESLDRFSREDALDVLGEFTKVLKAGVTIVTLIDRQTYSLARIKAEPMALFGSLMVMMRSHDESRTKGIRVGEAWEKKRRAAASQVLTTKVPGWLHVVEENGKRRIAFKPGADGQPNGKEVVRRIFADALAGYGKRQIAKRLQSDGVPTFGGGAEWHDSVVQKVLGSRATFGELQPYRRDGEGRRVLAGDPVKGYYPAAVTEAEFVRVGAAKRTRTIAVGRPRKDMVVNLFKGLAFCRCGGRMVRESKGPPPKGAVYLKCVKTVHGTCTNTRRWRLDWAEDRLLNSTVRLDLAKVLSMGDDGEPARFTVADMEAKIADLTRALENVLPLVEKGVEVYAERAIALQREINATKAEMAEMKRMTLMGEYEPSPDQRRASIRDLRARLQDADDKERAELQVRLAQEVRATVRKVVFGPNRMTATYQGFTMVGKVPKPAEVWVRLFTDDPDDLLDLAEMSFNPDRPEGPDHRVVEFVRRSRAAREPLPSSMADEAPHIVEVEMLPLGL